MKPLLCGFICLGLGLTSTFGQPNVPPFPEVWDPYSLRFEYSPNDSLYLSAGKRDTHTIVFRPRSGSVMPLRLPRPLRKSIRVLLRENTSVVKVNVLGNVQVKFRQPDGSSSDGPLLSGLISVEYKGAFRIRSAKNFSAGPATGLRFSPMDSSQVLVEGKAYRGQLEFYPDGSGLRCVNSLPLEHYLRGVVPLEMGRRDASALEALKAQAMVARTYAAKQMLADKKAFDVRATVQDQVYGGSEAEYTESDQAIRETEGLVVAHQDTLTQCYYYSTCGGRTASKHEVWGGGRIPYLMSQPDVDGQGQPWCQASGYMDWTRTWKPEVLSTILRTNIRATGIAAPPSFRKIEGLAVTQRFACGRIQTLRVETDQGDFELHGDKIRFGLKPGTGSGRILESARFEIRLEQGEFIAHGSGFGHGIGLCQMGAIARAQAGQSAREIVKAYYPETTLAKIQ